MDGTQLGGCMFQESVNYAGHFAGAQGNPQRGLLYGRPPSGFVTVAGTETGLYSNAGNRGAQ